MCGLFGFVNSSSYGFTRKETDLVGFLCYLDTLRGDDGTGMVLVKNDGAAMMLKSKQPGYDFIKEKPVDTLSSVSISSGKAIFGHNRKGTVGGFDDEHAHPFLINDRYIFVHNGKLDNHTKYFNTDVDSEALGMVLCPEADNIPSLEKKLGEISVAMACVWYDRVKHKLYFLRNWERPLYYTVLKDKGFVWASEKWMLNSAIEVAFTDVIVAPKAFDVETLYSIDLSLRDPVLVEEKLSVKKAPPTYTVGTMVTGKGKKNIKPQAGSLVVQKNGDADNDESSFFRGQSDAATTCLLSKSRYKRTGRKLLADNTIVAWVEDVIPKAGGCDWLVYATNEEEYPGWVFEWDLTGATKIFVEEEVEGRLIYGKINNIKYEREIQKGCGIFNPATVKISPRSFLTKEKRTTQCH